MNKGQVTIKDIAKLLNISSSTVSRALSNHPDISPETKKSVNDMAKQLDYRPDSIAQSLKNRRTNIIGVIVPEIKHRFFSAAISGIEDVAYGADYAIMVSQSNESFEREQINIRAMVSNRIAGLLISISQTTTNSDHFLQLKQRKIPFVFFDRVCEDIEASKVVVDDFKGAFKVVEHMIQSGYTKIAHLAGPKYLSISQERINGYRSALGKYSIPLNENLIVYGGLNEEDGICGFRKLMNAGQVPDAIFAVNDPVAIGAFEEIKRHGMKIPDDIAIAGFSNNPISFVVDPPLTTVDQHPYEVGREAARILISEIECKTESVTTVKKVLDTTLIIRKST
ncbi:MAG: LacI family DNA-binding transcriptional regulator [Candidatus Neomarinimicrobiota bacterium]